MRPLQPEAIGRLDLKALAFSGRILDDAKVRDHHAILPTEKEPRNLPPALQNVFDAVVIRLIECFYPACVKEVTTVSGESNAVQFKARGVRVVEPGWTVLSDTFDPKRLYFWAETLFTDYRKAFPDHPRLTSHMLRKRAFTMAWEKGIDARQASIAYGCNVDTLMKHYVKLDEQQVTDDVFAKMHGLTPPEDGGKKQSPPA